ncbi:MAG TPA: metalloregulator ArsR/SmtB family transcription factor [Polyangiaceae bacterium]|jgi:DNA-binding transcriptional ArsR family regulator|nr:metalloregulator ArsR/SmtB family transcription factor [Polyangiaceae bacterium]
MHALDALGNSVRREILVALRKKPLALHELAERFPVSRPAISRHVRLLEEAGLVEASRQGRESVYSVRMQGFNSVREFVESFWDVALGRLAALAKNGGRRK